MGTTTTTVIGALDAPIHPVAVQCGKWYFHDRCPDLFADCVGTNRNGSAGLNSAVAEFGKFNVQIGYTRFGCPPMTVVGFQIAAHSRQARHRASVDDDRLQFHLALPIYPFTGTACCPPPHIWRRRDPRRPTRSVFPKGRQAVTTEWRRSPRCSRCRCGRGSTCIRR